MSNAPSSTGDHSNSNIGGNKSEDFQFTTLAELEEEDNYNNKNNNWDSLSDLGFVPSDFDPTPLDTLLSLNQNQEEGDNNTVDPFVLTELLDSLGDDYDSAEKHYGVIRLDEGEDLSLWRETLTVLRHTDLDSNSTDQDSSYNTSDLASIHSDFFETDPDSPNNTTDELLQDLFSSLTTDCDIATTHVKEEQPCSISDQLSRLSIMKTEKETQSTQIDVVAAEPFLRTFKKRHSARSCMGHKETIFSVKFSFCQRFAATASQDSTVKLWDVDTNKCIGTLTGHNVEYECLRVAWASADWTKHLPLLRDDNTTDNEDLVMGSSSANGIVKIWRISIRDSLTNPKTECIATIDHAETDEDVPQVYALQFITHWMGTTSTEDCAHSTASATRSLLLTSSDDKIHLWELFIRTNESENTNDSNSSPSHSAHSASCFRKMLTYHFVCLQKGNGGVVLKIGSENADVIPHSEPSCLSAPEEQHVFGGDRNPNNVIYVFDASHCHANGLLAVALADGTTRIINGRGVCVAILQLPGCNSHLTAVCWNIKGDRISTSVATGQVILWKLEPGSILGRFTPSCQAVLEGGHQVGKPLFGVCYCGSDEEDLLLSWGVDGRLCLWNSDANGHSGPIATLLCNPKYPIYSVDILKQKTPPHTADKGLVAVAGGRDSGFIGMEFFLYDV